MDVFIHYQPVCVVSHQGFPSGNSRMTTWNSFNMCFRNDLGITILSVSISTLSHIENALLSFTFLFLTLPVIWSFIWRIKLQANEVVILRLKSYFFQSYPQLSYRIMQDILNFIFSLYCHYHCIFKWFAEFQN